MRFPTARTLEFWINRNAPDINTLVVHRATWGVPKSDAGLFIVRVEADGKEAFCDTQEDVINFVESL